jgi:tetratricopeptide (TPR) repeat protein
MLFHAGTRTAAYVAWEGQLKTARLAYEGGFYAAAKRNYRKALSLGETLPLKDTELSSNLIGLGLACCHLKEFQEAEDLFKRVIQMSEESGDSVDNTNLADALMEIAVLYHKTGNLVAAKDLLQRCLRLFQEVPGNYLNLARTMKSLALVHCKMDELNDAENLINKALTLLEAHNRKPEQLYAEVLGVMSIIAVQRKQFEEAKNLLERAVAILEVATGGEHPEIAEFMDYASTIFRTIGCMDKAEELTKQANALRLRLKARDR